MNTEQARFNMIEQQIRPWDVLDPRVLNALHDVPREDFVPEKYRDLAFVDMNIRLDHDQVMMQPKVEARLLQELAPTSSDSVLEIGTGSGYMTALLASLAGKVESVDIFPDFIESAREKLAAHDFNNFALAEGDAARGWSGNPPYDAIILTGSLPTLPPSYEEILAPGGRLIAVVGQDPIMEARLVIRQPDGTLSRISLFDTIIPPLLNAELPDAFEF